MSSQITCPNCHFHFDVDEVLSQEAENKLQEKFAQEKVQLQKQALQEQEQLRTQLMAQQNQEKLKWEKQLREELALNQKTELERLAQQVKTRDDALAKARAQETKLLAEKDQWELQKQDFILENKRQLDEEREKIMTVAKEKALAEQELIMKEKDKKIADAQAELATVKRKLEQGSQQLQGEILELALEDSLRAEFNDDVIEPIGKGVNGADIRQKVFDKNGASCGVIIWESKRTKNWTEGWVAKLKQDRNQENADLAILVSTVLPKNLKTFGFYNGIWTCEPNFALQLATLLRFDLVRVRQVKLSQENQDEKLSNLYDYMTSPRFVQKIETLVENFVAMKNDLDKERRVLTKRWSEREEQINRLMENTSRLYGELQTNTNHALPKVSLLELE